MKIINYKYILIALIVSLVFSCKNDHDEHAHEDHEGHDHETTAIQNEHEDHEENNKEVHLNQAQYDNAEIDTGWFSMKNINDVVNANGYTKLDPQDEAVVSFPVEGMVKSIKIIEGNRVSKGQTLATVSSLAFSDLLLERSKLEEELAISRAKLSYLELDYNRQNELAENNINAKKAFEKASSELQVEKSRITSVEKQIGLMDAKINMIGNQGSSIISIKAPISGFVTEINVKTGSIIEPSTPLFYIVDNSQMHVDLLVYEKDLGKLMVGQTVRFMLTNQSNKEIKGTVYNIGKSFANDTKSVAVHADIEKNDENLIPGMYINALIDIGSNLVRTLPEDAIVMAEGRNFIYITKKIDEHDHEHEGHSHAEEEQEIEFTRVEVRTKSKQLGYVSVTPVENIPDGSRIVIKGAYYLQSHLQKSEGGGAHSH